MTLRERRKAGGHEDEVTPPPTASRRGRGTGTPRGKATAGPTTPLARKAIQNTRMASPSNTEDVSMTPTGHGGTNPMKESPKTPTQASPAIPVSQLPPLPPSTNTTPVAHQDKSEHSPDTPTTQRPRPEQTGPSTVPDIKIIETQQPRPERPVTKGPDGGKIMLRFKRPSPLPPSEIPSLPSPISPLPPSHSTLYPTLPHLSASSEHLSIDQRLAYREGSASTATSATSEDYLSARSVPSEQERDKKESTLESSTSSDSPWQMPGGLK